MTPVARQPNAWQRSSPRSLFMNVLVVDDESLVRWSLAEILRRDGHTVVEARSAREARAALNRPGLERIDGVLLDLCLPDSTGLSLLEEVRSRCPASVVVLMTAYGPRETVDEALELGAFRVLDKPFDMRAVGPLVVQACRSNRMH
jgi:DNA-binding NtrC family response regulator